MHRQLESDPGTQVVLHLGLHPVRRDHPREQNKRNGSWIKSKTRFVVRISRLGGLGRLIFHPEFFEFGNEFLHRLKSAVPEGFGIEVDSYCFH